MSRRASAITLSIFIMMIVLAVLLGFTAFYVDQTMVRPIVLMQDTETSLRCFFVLSSIIGNEYISEGEVVPENTIRSKLIETYNVSSVNEIYKGKYTSDYDRALEIMYGDSDFVIKNEVVFWTAVGRNNLPLACSMNVFGPVRTGTAGIFTTSNANQIMDEWQRRIYG